MRDAIKPIQDAIDWLSKPIQSVIDWLSGLEKRAGTYSWFFVHNVIAHPLLVFWPSVGEALHEYSYSKMATEEDGGILEELERELVDQVSQGRDLQHGVEEHSDGVLLDAVVGLLDPGNVRAPDWVEHYQTKPHRRQAIIAATLLVAEIRRRDIALDWSDFPDGVLPAATWTAVDDGLPERDVLVLVYVSPDRALLGNVGVGRVRWTSPDTTGWHLPVILRGVVRYWRPLPPSPVQVVQTIRVNE